MTPSAGIRKDMIPVSNPIITIEMENGGVIKAELYPEIAPNTVNNFIHLIQKGFYAVSYTHLHPPVPWH